ncbi:MAG: hypothetical protein U1E51_07625 [Candidatus Binatia bacterium]|nr:hypothetical protein [Candidatus Binatia bacterium]
MATDAIITLERLRCIRESDGTGHSEPYIWPALLWIDDNTLATPLLVGVTAPVLGNARVVIKNDMRAGQTADIPTSVGVLRVRFEDGLTIRRLILAVALWEEDETPEAAMRAGFQAFSSELRAAVADNLFALSQASEEETDAIIETIKTRVSDRVRSAIENGLTGWQKARVFIGTLNLDDIIDSAFRSFPDLLSTPIALAFRAGSSNDYEIQGNLQVRPVRVDRCQAQVNAVKAAQSVVDGVDQEIRQLQTELQHASPGEKPFIISEIKRIREEDLADAMAALDNARVALSICRSRIPPVFPDTVVAIASDRATGNKVGVDEKEIQGFKTKTFFDNSENVEVTIASDGKSTIVAVPKTAISRRNQMGDDEYKCLKACKDIADLERRLNCILLCPVTKQYQVFIF